MPDGLHSLYFSIFGIPASYTSRAYLRALIFRPRRKDEDWGLWWTENLDVNFVN